MHKFGLRMAAIVSALFIAAVPAMGAEEQAGKATADQVRKPESDATTGRQIESGARQIGRGVEEAAKGVVQGSKEAGRKIGEAAKEAKPAAKSAWENFKTAATDAGRSVKTFFARLFDR